MARAAGAMIPPALVLAGSRGEADPVAAAAVVSAKPLADVGGETMLARVVAALRAAGTARILVSANDPAVVAEAVRLGTEPVGTGHGPSASVAAAFAAAGAPLLVTTADHALLRPEWVTRFVSDAPVTADVAALLARRDAVEAAVPDTRRTWLRFADGAWSGCNLFLLATPRAAAAIDLWREVEADRKRPWRIVRRLGPATLLRYVVGRLTLAEALARLGRIAGVRAAAVASPYGLAAVDVDSAADLALARSIIAGGYGNADRAHADRRRCV